MRDSVRQPAAVSLHSKSDFHYRYPLQFEGLISKLILDVSLRTNAGLISCVTSSQRKRNISRQDGRIRLP